MEALTGLLRALPASLAATVVVVLHVPPTGTSALTSILRRATPLRVETAAPGVALEHGLVLVAPPDRHVVVVPDAVMLSRGPRENGHRPAIDVLFRTAARSYGPRVIAVQLSGALDDGAAGCVAVKSRGGLVLVQDPEEATYPSMPQSVIALDTPRVLTLAEIAETLVTLVQERVDMGEAPPPTRLVDTEVAIAMLDSEALNDLDRPGVPSGLSCPDCHGTLFALESRSMLRYRCRVGHAWASQGLLAQKDEEMESALWVALRSLEEKAELSHRLAEQARAAGHALSVQTFTERSREAQRSSALIRRLLEQPQDEQLAAALSTEVPDDPAIEA